MTMNITYIIQNWLVVAFDFQTVIELFVQCSNEDAIIADDLNCPAEFADFQ